jgi:hypothetical protein
MKTLRRLVQGDQRGLTKKLVLHGTSVLVVTVLLGIVTLLVEVRRDAAREEDKSLAEYLALKNVDFGDPVDRAMFRESLDVFYPERDARNDSLMVAIDNFRQRQFTNPLLKSGNELQGLTIGMIGTIAGMFLQFLFLYTVVLGALYVLAERIAVYRFVKMKQHDESYAERIIGWFREWHVRRRTPSLRAFGSLGLLLLKMASKGFVLVLLFSPAYVLAYAVKTSVDTSSLLFMVLLGIISNGVLIHASNRFYSVLVTESHKGYVQTALVKGLNASYEWDRPGGIPRRALLNIRTRFSGHVFGHIFMNARFQFIPALKEQASFLVTGLIIIEMALNVQGHLSYELLQQILYRQYDVACAIILCIFLTVKGTEVLVDIWHDREKRRYGF